MCIHMYSRTVKYNRMNDTHRLKRIFSINNNCFNRFITSSITERSIILKKSKYEILFEI